MSRIALTAIYFSPIALFPKYVREPETCYSQLDDLASRVLRDTPDSRFSRYLIGCHRTISSNKSLFQLSRFLDYTISRIVVPTILTEKHRLTAVIRRTVDDRCRIDMHGKSGSLDTSSSFLAWIFADKENIGSAENVSRCEEKLKISCDQSGLLLHSPSVVYFPFAMLSTILSTRLAILILCKMYINGIGKIARAGITLVAAVS